MSSPRTGDQHPDLDVFLRRYLSHAGSQLPDRAPSTLAGIGRSHFEFGASRPGDRILVRVRELGGDSSAVELITRDAPYLVDSVRAELERTGLTVERLLHPQLVLERDDAGAITKVYDLDDDAAVPNGAIIESWMHIEINRVTSHQADEIARNVSRVLADVHAAVDDSPYTYALIRRLADQLAIDPGQFGRDASVEAGDLLRWLADGNFLILGHLALSANDLASPGRIAEREAHGVLRRGNITISPAELLPAYRSGAPLVIFKSPLISTVQRSARYDCLTVVTPASEVDEPQMIHVFLGLFPPAEDGGITRVPVVRQRLAEILHRSGIRANSHGGRQMLAALRTLPRDELLEAPTADLQRLAQLVVARAEQRSVGVFVRTHLNRDFLSVLVYFPADRFGPETRRRVRKVVMGAWPGELIHRDDRIVELDLARMQFLIALPPGTQPPTPDRGAVETEVARVTRRWSDDLADLLTVLNGEELGEQLLRRYATAFPEAYKESFTASTAVRDIARLESLADEDGLAFDVYIPEPDDEADRRLKVFRTGQALTLARALPIFTQMGIEVLDERPFEIDRPDDSSAWIYDFGLRLPNGSELDEPTANNVVDALRLLWAGEVEQDGFNALVLRAGMSWWQVNLLRAYAKYLRQVGTIFSQRYIEQALVDNPVISQKLVELFEARFDPARVGSLPVVTGPDDSAPHERPSLVESIEADLAAVASLDQDRILRSILGLLNATLRTTAYQCSADQRTALVAMKLDPRRIPELPEPRPKAEIWVYSPRVEGVHLRFGAVARGGLRWSDRLEDFRTEVLGLVKAQMVKNAVIVPVGAKGGFVAKRANPQDRDAFLAEGVACYRTFISALLDLTDNYAPAEPGQATPRVVPPPNTRRYDGDDPYLVVAADKGTATFSDIANEIAVARGFWLGDAFASGGSVGYDHKAMGITARGAWESVKYHFRELGLDTQTQDFTVVGIGDMSGDVFGNGMLLSEHIRLVAAFDHRHVFLDPTPDAATSIVERRRLFELPRSSWADYDPALISTGGGVFPRTLKAIPVSAAVRQLLGLPDSVTQLAPADLIHAILLAPVDLLWNGGIGTYVKAASESNASAGDKANDAVRVDGGQLRARVVGEGGNLGLTQLGRIEYAQSGGAINTDAIDNSAGVDTSDHEVNIKILLDQAVAAGDLDVAGRNAALAAVTDDVAALVLRDNYEQNVLLGIERSNSRPMVRVIGRYLNALVGASELERGLEFLPSARELAQREASGAGLTSPEAAVLAAYAKITLTTHINDSTLPDEAWFHRVLSDYFPKPIADRFGSRLFGHPLHREIITTWVVNDMVNRAGTTFAFRAQEESGVDYAQIARAYSIVREVFDLVGLWDAIKALDNQVPTSAQHIAYREIHRLIDRATRWFIDLRFPISDVAGEIDRFGPAVAELAPTVAGMLGSDERSNLLAETDRLVAVGLPRELGARIANLLDVFQLLDVVEIAAASDRPAREVAELHFGLSERYRVVEVLNQITLLPRDDRWSALARAALRHDLYAALSEITKAVLRATSSALSVDKRIGEWEDLNAERVSRARATVNEALGCETIDLATLSVALRVLRGLPVV
jgi:glutamate dehydrogenase